MTTYEYDYTVDGKYCVFFGDHKTFINYVRKLSARGYRVQLIDRRRHSVQPVYGNVY